MTERERLAELIRSAMIWGWTEPSEIAERLLDEGVICPPCKVGDVVYCLDDLVDNDKCGECEHYDSGGMGDLPSCMKNHWGSRHPECLEISEQKATDTDIAWWLYMKAFKKFVFLSREEAEAALAERRKA